MVLAHQDAWRKHPFLSNCSKKPFPGLGIAAGIFSVYLVVDAVTGGSSSHAHGHGGSSKFTYVKEEIGERSKLEE
ncbi:hypothetical protein THRCLA_23291 [Thraustotheca clavata]|uniref:Uncharacterized protein n=1 Tax=Thraustotheca clavata TaxID=74557 RepID=A0A1V9Y7Y0_9STRA|nr:hypothetical protein THRCLA_23291 [Thraustotheca clavata]